MKKSIIILTIIAVFWILFSIFLYKQPEYVAGEYRYYTKYEKYKAKEKSIDFSSKAYNEDKYNLKRLKDITEKEIDKLDKYRTKLVSINYKIYNSNNTVSDYENYFKILEELVKEIKISQDYYNWQKNDLYDLSKFIRKIEKDLYSIKLYEADISHVSSVVNSMDSTASKYLNSTKLLKYASASKGLKLVKQIEKEKSRKRQVLIARIEQEKDLEKKIKEKSIDSYNSYSNYSSSDDTYNIRLTSSYSKIHTPISPNYSNYNFSSKFYSTSTNPNHVKVDGYHKSDGTYVKPYIRTAPNNTIIDNFSTSPNLNPYTGKIGTIKFK